MKRKVLVFSCILLILLVVIVGFYYNNDVYNSEAKIVFSKDNDLMSKGEFIKHFVPCNNCVKLEEPMNILQNKVYLEYKELPKLNQLNYMEIKK